MAFKAKKAMSPLPEGALPTLYKKTSGGKSQMWRTWVEIEGEYGVVCVEHGLEDGKRQFPRDTITEGKNVGRSNATTPIEQAVLEAKASWEEKKSRKGYGLNVEESAAKRAVGPMLAHKYADHVKKIDWGTAFAQPKFDGFRCLVRREGKEIKFVSREYQGNFVVDHLAEAFVDLAADVQLDGELYIHGMSLNEISSACKKRGPNTDKVGYRVYDCLDAEAPYEARATFVKDVVTMIGSDLIQTVETVKVRSAEELARCEATFLEEGYEGAMLRHGRLGYEAGKRSMHLLKVKQFEDGEFEITDYKMSRGKLAGCPVFVCQTAEGHSFDVLAHGTIEEKKALGEKAADCIGKKLTVKYQYLTKTDEPVPFLPVAKGLR